jgi:hypothetical protein
VRTQIFPCSAASVLPPATRHRLCVLSSNLQRSLIASASSSATCTLLAQFLLPPSPPPNVVLPWLLQHTTARIVGGCAGGIKPWRGRPGGLARLEALPWRHGAPAEAVRLMWLRPLEIKILAIPKFPLFSFGRYLSSIHLCRYGPQISTGWTRHQAAHLTVVWWHVAEPYGDVRVAAWLGQFRLLPSS